MKILLNLLLLVVASYCHHNHNRDHRHDHDNDGSDTPKQPITVSPYGEFHGGYNVTRRGRKFETYRGIRYAQPPISNLRFEPPVPILEYKSPVDASEDGPACPFRALAIKNIDEDCLTINVYTPLKKDRTDPLPVIFFIHAGGFYSMTGRSDLAGPHYLLDRDIVLVTINYRIGSLGFLSTGDELAPGNNGFKDQVVALQWVQRNIAAFGGNPNKVTIAGCSAGSTSVMLHMVSPMSKDLFHRAISMSGSPLKVRPFPNDLYQLAVRQAEIVDCPTTSSKAIVECLKNKPWKDIGNSVSGFYEFGYDPLSIWVPVVEKDFGQERFLPIDPETAIKEGKMNAVPYIISQTQDEFFWKAFTIIRNETLLDKMNSEWESIAPISFLLPKTNASYTANRLRTEYLHDKPLKNDNESAKNLGLLYQDSIVSYPVHKLVNLMSRHSPQPVWYYEFAYIGTNSYYQDLATEKPLGAAHHDDLIYLFPLSLRFPAISTNGSDSTTVDRMTGIWYNFARHGDPNYGDLPELENFKWPRFLPDNRQYLRIDTELKVQKNLKEDRMKIWEELFPMSY
ncbi:juvenile hormone esterase-like [Vanessa atalanta]|uniref:juvenile hormone esterase-like n=1 Tax=Vanessa atalanta TaxID=42275 RepID=UPI001FCE29D4|nr:juvenile hormone esterase-like [Vanessa atalanta]